MRTSALALSLLLIPMACDKSGDTTPPADATPPAADTATTEPEASETEEDPRLAAAEARAAKSLERWTPELREEAQTLRGTEWASLDAAMRLFTQAEFLEQENRYKCERCKQLVRARKQFTLRRPARCIKYCGAAAADAATRV